MTIMNDMSESSTATEAPELEGLVEICEQITKSHQGTIPGKQAQLVYLGICKTGGFSSDGKPLYDQNKIRGVITYLVGTREIYPGFILAALHGTNIDEPFLADMYVLCCSGSTQQTDDSTVKVAA